MIPTKGLSEDEVVEAVLEGVRGHVIGGEGQWGGGEVMGRGRLRRRG